MQSSLISIYKIHRDRHIDDREECHSLQKFCIVGSLPQVPALAVPLWGPQGFSQPAMTHHGEIGTEEIFALLLNAGEGRERGSRKNEMADRGYISGHTGKQALGLYSIKANSAPGH